ncbi:hypothetical protein CDAR_14181 [Caerostris darwini]|uniref:Uncharacterized protein n=1 Tax=Caerostris darwini TaxID=1538125 RepID=A0AAV4QBB7_9ARAC|nr:hypothetical protein CDAR_14181 [Caerostris darwini]
MSHTTVPQRGFSRKQPRKSKRERRAAVERVVDARNELSPSFQEVCRREWRPLAALVINLPSRDSHSLIAGWGSSPSPRSEVKGVVNEGGRGMVDALWPPPP